MYGTDEEEKKASKPLEKVQLKHLIIAFIILGVGCFVAFVVFLLEVIFKSKKYKKRNRAVKEKIKIWKVTHPND